MAVYYLHLRDGVDEILDEDGSDHATLSSLHDAALHAAREIISHDALTGCINLTARIDAEDEEGSVVLTVAFSDAVAIRR